MRVVKRKQSSIEEVQNSAKDTSSHEKFDYMFEELKKYLKKSPEYKKLLKKERIE